MIRIFELKIEGQGHEEQRAVLRNYMANCMTYQISGRIAGLHGNFYVWFIIKSYMHALYLLFHVKDMKFSLDLEKVNQGEKKYP